MNYMHYGDFETFMLDEGRDAMFFYCVTDSPFEYWEDQCCRIVEVINIPNDYLIGLVKLVKKKGEFVEQDSIFYYPLSKLRLSRKREKS